MEGQPIGYLGEPAYSLLHRGIQSKEGAGTAAPAPRFLVLDLSELALDGAFFLGT